MANPFVHIELQTKDLAKAKDFYSRLFDWKLENLPVAGDDMPYTMLCVMQLVTINRLATVFAAPHGSLPAARNDLVTVDISHKTPVMPAQQSF